MTITELFLKQLETETVLTRRVLERVPEGRNDWKPHQKSMPLGYLAALVARMPAWLAMMLKQDEHDIRPPGGSSTYTPTEWAARPELLKMFEDSVREARDAFADITDDHLMKPWGLVVSGRVVNEEPRYQAISNAVFSHLAHHRGQLTVYLRLNDVPVPALYGPSADEGGF
jgi:uncharacterized damage-inducible protein DinB